MQVKVYFASKLAYRDLWKKYDGFSPRVIESVTRWVDYVLDSETQGFDYNVLRCRQGWIANEEDIRAANVVIVFAGFDGADVLRGALVEAGMAIALGKPVVVVGESDSYGTWQHHPSVHKASTLVDACNLAVSLTVSEINHGLAT
jgi:hypothetical protein